MEFLLVIKQPSENNVTSRESIASFERRCAVSARSVTGRECACEQLSVCDVIDRAKSLIFGGDEGIYGNIQNSRVLRFVIIDTYRWKMSEHRRLNADMLA